MGGVCCPAASKVQDSPTKRKTTNSISYASLNATATLVECQGWRPRMEDRCFTAQGVASADDFLVAAVFDGHGGDEMAQMAKDSMLDVLRVNPTLEGRELEYFRDAFVAMDTRLRAATTNCGTTALVVFVGSRHYVVANCGDCRCVLSRAGKQMQLSDDHKPSKKAERRRILDSGMHLLEGGGLTRVMARNSNLSLAVSRSLGDFDFKQPNVQPEEDGVTCVPDVLVEARTDEDDFIIIASDGVFDVFESWEAVSYVNSRLKLGRPMWEVGEALVDECLKRGSMDNMTLLLVDVSTEALDRFVPTEALDPPTGMLPDLLPATPEQRDDVPRAHAGGAEIAGGPAGPDVAGA